MKKFFTAAMSILMLCSLSSPAFAVDSLELERTLSNGDYRSYIEETCSFSKENARDVERQVDAIIVREAQGNISLVNKMLNDADYREYIRNKYNVDEISACYNVDPEVVTDVLITGPTQDRFSPFTEIKERCSNLEAVEETLMTVSVQEPIMPLAEHIYNNQDSTAYLATGNPGASGTMPWVGSCAVHRANSSTGRPLIPFGTTVSYLNRTVTIDGEEYSSFVVNDTGDPNNRFSLYWTDVYWGDNTSENYTEAINYGVRKVQLYFFD